MLCFVQISSAIAIGRYDRMLAVFEFLSANPINSAQVMPFSQSSQLSPIVTFLEQLQPASILDVGVGMGLYGFLARTYLENEHLFIVDGAEAAKRPKSEWRIRIDGIEAFNLYQTPVHDYAYNHIYWDDALNRLPLIDDNAYELVIAIDILEHFTTEEGIRFLDQLKRVSSRKVLISTPKAFIHQEIEANPFENHRSLWTESQLQEQGFDETIPNDFSWLAVCTI